MKSQLIKVDITPKTKTTELELRIVETSRYSETHSLIFCNCISNLAKVCSERTRVIHSNYPTDREAFQVKQDLIQDSTQQKFSNFAVLKHIKDVTFRPSIWRTVRVPSASAKCERASVTIELNIDKVKGERHG